MNDKQRLAHAMMKTDVIVCMRNSIEIAHKANMDISLFMYYHYRIEAFISLTRYIEFKTKENRTLLRHNVEKMSLYRRKYINKMS